MKMELVGIEIATENGKTKLKIEEAKALYLQLHEIFGEKVINIPSSPVIVRRWQTWPPQVTYTTENPLPPPTTIITCQGKMIE